MKSLFLICFLSFGTFSDYEYQYIKIINLQRKPIVEAMLNGKKAYFLLDTGSDITILNKKDSQKYGFNTMVREGEKHDAVGIGGKTTSLTSAGNVYLVLGSTRIMTHFLSFDLSAIAENSRQDCGIKINGILGSDAMKRYGIVIDYKNKQMGILTSKKAALNDKMLSRKNLEWQEN